MLYAGGEKAARRPVCAAGPEAEAAGRAVLLRRYTMYAHIEELSTLLRGLVSSREV